MKSQAERDRGETLAHVPSVVASVLTAAALSLGVEVSGISKL